MKHTTLFSVWVMALLFAGAATAQPLDTYDIYVVNPAVGVSNQVTSIAGFGEFNPDWAPNRRLIVHDVVFFGPAGYQDLFITNVVTGVSTPLLGGEGGNDAAWAPNGRRIAFDRFGVDSSLYVVPATGGTRTLIQEDAIEPDWSPNGKCIVFQRPSDGTVNILDLRTGGVEFVDEGYNPNWSPNGRHIAYGKEGDIWRVATRRCSPMGPQVQLTLDPADDSQPFFSRNSRRIVFHTPRAGDYDLWVVNTFGGAPPVPLFGNPAINDFDPAVGGKRVAFASSSLPDTPSETVHDGGTEASLSSYPDPFNPSTNIQFSVLNEGPVTLRVYDIMGREVAALLDGSVAAGDHSVRFDAGYLPAGVYLYRLTTTSGAVTKQFTLLK